MLQVLALASLTGLAGCAMLGPLNPPRRLLEQAHAAVEEHDPETAYSRLAEIRRKYPHSEQSTEAFPLAAALFERGYFQSRYAPPDSHWIGMHAGYFREYLELAHTRPELSRWTVRAADDDGIVESISAERPSATTPIAR